MNKFGAKGKFEIPLFAILTILSQIRENSLIWSHHCSRDELKIERFAEAWNSHL